MWAYCIRSNKISLQNKFSIIYDLHNRVIDRINYDQLKGCVITKYGWTNSIKCQNVIKYPISQLNVLCLPNERKFTLLRPSWHVKVKKERYWCYCYLYNITYSLEPLISTPFLYSPKITRLWFCVFYRHMINLKLNYRSIKLQSFANVEPYYYTFKNHFNQFTKKQLYIFITIAITYFKSFFLTNYAPSMLLKLA